VTVFCTVYVFVLHATGCVASCEINSDDEHDTHGLEPGTRYSCCCL